MAQREISVPFLRILEEPCSAYRYRYKSDGAKGCLYGELGKKSKKPFPKVKLENPPSIKKDIFIQVDLFTDEDNPKPHPFPLKGKDDKLLIKLDGNYTAEFHVSIFRLNKTEISDEMESNFIEKRRNFQGRPLTDEEQNKLREINLKRSRLGFRAVVEENGHFEPLPDCDWVFSHGIEDRGKHSKGDQIGLNLRISRLSICSGNAQGGNEVILLCDKVDKKDIVVELYEPGTDWHHSIKPTEVHHQVAIIFTTPSYKEVKLSEPKDVLMRLKNSTGTSEPRTFKYIPNQTGFESDLQHTQTKKRKISKSVGAEAMFEDSLLANNSEILNMDPEIMEEIIGDFAKIVNDDTIRSLTGFMEFEDVLEHQMYNPSSPARGSSGIEYQGPEVPGNLRKPKLYHDGPQNQSASFELNSKPATSPKPNLVVLRLLLKQVALYFIKSVDPEMLSNKILSTKILNVLIKFVDDKNINLKHNADGQTLLHYALLYRPKLLDALLNKKVSAIIPDYKGNTAIHLAVVQNHWKYLPKLCAAHNACNILNYEGQSPLHLAVASKNLNCTKALLQAHADPTVKDYKDNLSAYQMAAKNNFSEGVQLIKEHMKSLDQETSLLSASSSSSESEDSDKDSSDSEEDSDEDSSDSNEDLDEGHRGSKDSSSSTDPNKEPESLCAGMSKMTLTAVDFDVLCRNLNEPPENWQKLVSIVEVMYGKELKNQLVQERDPARGLMNYLRGNEYDMSSESLKNLLKAADLEELCHTLDAT